MSFVLALDQGTTSSRAILFDRGGNVHAAAQQEFRQIFPQPGWVEHDADRNLGDAVGRSARGAGQGAHRRARRRRHRHHEPARDDGRSGNARPAARSPTPSSGRTAAPRRCATSCAQPATAPLFARKTGLVLDAYFSGTKVRWLLDHVDGARARAERGELAFGTIDIVARLATDRRPRALHRCEQRQPHAAVQHPYRRLGRRAPGDCSTFRARCCPRSCRPSRHLRTRADRRRSRYRSPAIAGDQQAALFGQACLTPGTREEHLRHRLLPADEHRRRRPSRRATTCSRRSPGSATGGRTTRSKAACSSAARSCSGCATACRSSAARPRSRRSRRACPTTAASIWCRRSPGWARRTGTRTRAARSSA